MKYERGDGGSFRVGFVGVKDIAWGSKNKENGRGVIKRVSKY